MTPTTVAARRMDDDRNLTVEQITETLAVGRTSM